MTVIRELNVGGSRRAVPGRGGARARLSGYVGKVWRRVSVLPLVVGFLAFVLAVIGIMALTAQRGATTEVWVAATDIRAGQPLAADDVRVATVVGVVDFGHLVVSEVPREELLGQMVPRVELAAGTPLSAGQFHRPGEFAAIEPGSMTVAVVVSRARVPAGVTEGDTVLLVGVPGSTGGSTAGDPWPGSDVLEAEATVVAIDEYQSGSDLSLTVSVPAEIGADAAWLASENRLVVAHVH